LAGKRRVQLEDWFEHELLESFRSRSRSVTKTTADRWAAIADGLIAATALEHELSLVTRNIRDFADTGATIFNPWEA
jgi:predicted nucleic acid-binding protein